MTTTITPEEKWRALYYEERERARDWANRCHYFRDQIEVWKTRYNETTRQKARARIVELEEQVIGLQGEIANQAAVIESLERKLKESRLEGSEWQSS